MTERLAAFTKAQTLADGDKPDEALEVISAYTSEEDAEYSTTEMTIINLVICEKLTSASFEDKKDACLEVLPIVEGVKILKDAAWLESYNETVYDIFSKLSRCARDEQREEMWNRLKEIYYEITLAAKKVWKEKNALGGLTVYLNLSKLCKSYCDVADEDSFKMCETAAKEAKFCGKGRLDDDDWKDANKMIETIKKNISDAQHERELIKDV